MTPSLDGAYARVARAREHLAALASAVASVSVPANTTGAFEDIGTATPVDPIHSILVGEITYNLRSALDYLIYELALLDTASIQEKTQFLIIDSPSDWKQEAKRRLPGLSPVHQDAIRMLQPFSGCQWTRTLRDTSNSDKHRHLAIVQAPSAAVVELSSRQAATIHLLAFDDGRPVVSTLEELCGNVTDVLDSFRPEFP